MITLQFTIYLSKSANAVAGVDTGVTSPLLVFGEKGNRVGLKS